MYYDYTYGLIIIGLIIAGWAQIRVSSAYKKYSRVASSRGIPGWQVARQILDRNGLEDIQIQEVAGNLTDHYDPRRRVLRLSKGVYSNSSVAALGIAAHEVGHAVQHKEGYMPLRLRTLLVPLAQIGSYASWILIIIGLFAGFLGLIQLGIILFSGVVLFQLVTLPVEYNASKRALAMLSDGGFLAFEEMGQTKKVLSAAAMTYVAAVLVSVLQLLRLVLLFGRRR
jgi:Zn-dependent membrane protease YugP